MPNESRNMEFFMRKCRGYIVLSFKYLKVFFTVIFHYIKETIKGVNVVYL